MNQLDEKNGTTLCEFPFNMGEKFRVLIPGKVKNDITYFATYKDAERKFASVTA